MTASARGANDGLAMRVNLACWHGDISPALSVRLHAFGTDLASCTVFVAPMRTMARYMALGVGA